MKYFLPKITNELLLILVFISLLFCCKNGESSKSSFTVEKGTNQLTTKQLEQFENDADPYFFSTLTIASKFGPNSISRNIIQDTKGDYWIASWEGIIHYDGKIFTNMTNKNLLRRWHVFAVMEDSKGNIWFGTIGAGVYLFDGRTFTNITTKDGLAYDRVTCLYEDTKGMIWFGTENGATRYDPTLSIIPNQKSMETFTKENGMPDHDINAIVQDNTGRYWFGTRGEAAFFDGETFSVIKGPNGDSFTNVRSIVKDKKGKMWMGGNDGLWCTDEKSYINYRENFVGFIYEDRQGNILTSEVPRGTRDWTLYHYDQETLYDEKVSPKILREQVGQLFGLMEDNDGQIWFGHEYGYCSLKQKVVNCYNEHPFPYERN